MRNYMNILTITAAATITASSLSGCYLYHQRDEALIQSIDVDQSLLVAAHQIRENSFTSVLGLWALRDQRLDSEQAARVSELYFEHIDRIDSEEHGARTFSVWHLTWAISNMYRLGDAAVQLALVSAYLDAEQRVDRLDKGIATRHFRDEKIHMGDIHFGGRAFARSHLVAPGNPDYMQSYEHYLDES